MIEHEGIIEQIDGDVAHVKIDSISACASCHAKGACSAADQEEKYLDVPILGAVYRQGETVKVHPQTDVFRGCCVDGRCFCFWFE